MIGPVQEVPTTFPGHELVSAGLSDLAAGRESESSLLVAMAAPRLRRLGFEVPAGGGERPSHRLYELLLRPIREPIAATTRWSREKITADEIGRSALSWSVRDCVAELSSHGFAQISGPFGTSDEAFDVAGALGEMCRLERGLPSLSVIGDFVLPPLDGAETRDFQTLHFDFGLPLDPKVEGDIARYTALYIPADVMGVHAVTRLVPLAALLAQRSWPAPAELLERLRSYGRTHGAWDDEEGYVEGSLARIIEAATAERSPILPSVKAEPGFLCGLEFDSLSAELAFFAGHGLCIDDAEIDINLQPGELLLFDNLALAHGRRGTRQPGELRQRVFGHHLQPAAQRELRDDVLTAFKARAQLSGDAGAVRCDSHVRISS